MHIERALPEDHAVLSSIAKTSKNVWGYGLEQIEQWSDDLTLTPEYIERNVVRKLIIESTAIGFYALLEINSNEVRLDFMFLSPDFMSKGFGKLLLNDAIAMASHNNYARISLEADPNAKGFYERHGFVQSGWVDSSVNGRKLPVMELWISA